jgi:glycosyltransferase involved in cell wall biosynthesis
MPRENILYVTPLIPRASGNGLAMRAGFILEALARRFDVHLFVVPVAGAGGPPDDFVRRHAVRIGRLDLARSLDPLFGLISRFPDPEVRSKAELAYPKPFLSRFCTGDSAHSLFEWANGLALAGLHVMRLYLAPLAMPFLATSSRHRPFCVLDLDDDDVRTYRRLMHLYNASGDARAAAAASAEADKFQLLAERSLDAFDRVLVCSDADAHHLTGRFPDASFAVVPNVYRPLDCVPCRIRRDRGPLRLLFVGTLGYFPNLDAALFLCREVLPVLRRSTAREVRIDLVGSGNDAALAELRRYPEATVHGSTDDLAPLYAAADVAVVPLRAGGGTRIKVLEAFAYGVPVVATRVGAEGIDADDGEQLLLAEEAEAFARACLDVKERPDLAATLTARAAALLAARYSPAQLDARLAEAYRPA